MKCEEVKPEPCSVDDMMTNEAVKVYGEAGGTISSPTADVAVRLSFNADKKASKDVFSVCSAPGGAVVTRKDAEFGPCV